MTSIYVRRNSFYNSEYALERCGAFKHPTRLAVVCPILPFQKIEERIVAADFSQSADRKRIILAFVEKIIRGDSFYLYSLSNCCFDDEQLRFNSSSIVGLMPLIKKGYFQNEELK